MLKTVKRGDNIVVEMGRYIPQFSKKYEVTIQIREKENMSTLSQLVVSTVKKERCKYWHVAIHSSLGQFKIVGGYKLSDSHVK